MSLQRVNLLKIESFLFNFEIILLSNCLIIKNMNSEEKNLKDKVNKNDNSKDKIEKKKNKNVNEKGASGIFTPLDIPIVSVFENHYSKEPLYEVGLDKFLHTTKFKTKVEEYTKWNI